MALANYQISYRGVVMGEGTNYHLVEVDGIHDMVVKDRDRDNPRTQGMMPGYHSATFRLIRVSLYVRGTAGSVAHEDDIQALMSAMSPDAHALPNEADDRLNFKFPGEDEKFIYCRPTRRSRPRRNASEYGHATARFELKVYDPRTYADFVTPSTLSGTFNVTNGGDAYAYPYFNATPDGSGNLKVTNNTNGDVVEFTNAGVAAGLSFDGIRFVQGRGDLLIAYRGAVNHYGDLVSPRNPMRLDPGINSITLNLGGGGNMYHRDTWM